MTDNNSQINPNISEVDNRAYMRNKFNLELEVSNNKFQEANCTFAGKHFKHILTLKEFKKVYGDMTALSKAAAHYRTCLLGTYDDNSFFRTAHIP
jgi:hypothetical protein